MICSCCYPLIFSDWCLTGEISKIQKKELPVQCLRLFSLTVVSNIKYSETKATSAFPSNDKWNCCSNVNMESTLEGFNILHCMKLWRLNDGPWGKLLLTVALSLHQSAQNLGILGRILFLFDWTSPVVSNLHCIGILNITFMKTSCVIIFKRALQWGKDAWRCNPQKNIATLRKAFIGKKIFLMKSFIKGRRNKGKMPEDPIP